MGKQVAARFMGLQLSRLERTPDKREVGSSSLLKPIVGVQLSWESTCLASRGSRVRISPSPLVVDLLKDTTEFSSIPASQKSYRKRKARTLESLRDGARFGSIPAARASCRLYLENFIHDKIDNQLIDDQDIQETNRKLYIIQQKSSLMNNFGRYVGNAIPGNISLTN